MSLTEQINQDIKAAMLAKDKQKLAALRAVKSALLLAATEKGDKTVDEATELKILQKLLKQRKESAELYKSQNREDLMAEELTQAQVLEVYMPKQMSSEELETAVSAIIAELGASSMADMGKVMGVASKKMAGKADGKVVADLVKRLLA